MYFFIRQGDDQNLSSVMPKHNVLYELPPYSISHKHMHQLINGQWIETEVTCVV